MIRKLLIAAVLIPAVWFGTAAMHFPPIFQKMFVGYILLGLTVFLLLDAPPFPTLAGSKSLAVLIGFYAVLSAVYIGGASFLPQYDPTVEKGKIDKIVKPKMDPPEARKARLEAMVKKSEELQAKTATLLAGLEKLAPSAPEGGKPVGAQAISAGGGDIIARGMEVYDLHECYNCHKIGGKGSVKKRGPILDNIGNLLTQDDV